MRKEIRILRNTEDAIPKIPGYHLRSIAVKKRKTRFYKANIRLTLLSVIGGLKFANEI